MIVGEFGPADNSESETYSVEFAPRLGAGESPTGTIWEIRVLGGLDPDPESHLDGPPAIVGTETRQRISFLIAGCTYELTALFMTNHGNTLAVVGIVTCET